MKRVIVHIDRLVFKGIDPRARHRIAADLRVELSRSLADLATVAQHGTAASTGAIVGRAIARGLKR